MSIADVAAVLDVDAHLLDKGFSSVLAAAAAATPLRGHAADACTRPYRSKTDCARHLRALQLSDSNLYGAFAEATLEREYWALFEPYRRFRACLAAAVPGSVSNDDAYWKVTNALDAAESESAGVAAAGASASITGSSAAAGADGTAGAVSGVKRTRATMSGGPALAVRVYIMHACHHSGPTPLQLVLRNSAAVTNLKAAIVRATGIPVDRQHLMRTAGALTDGNSALAMLSPTEQQHLLVHELARPGSTVLIAKQDHPPVGVARRHHTGRKGAHSRQ